MVQDVHPSISLYGWKLIIITTAIRGLILSNKLPTWQNINNTTNIRKKAFTKHTNPSTILYTIITPSQFWKRNIIPFQFSTYIFHERREINALAFDDKSNVAVDTRRQTNNMFALKTQVCRNKKDKRPNIIALDKLFMRWFVLEGGESWKNGKILWWCNII